MSTRPWWSHVLQWSIWLVVMYALMGWLSRARSRPRASSEAGRLPHPTGYLIVSVVCTAFFASLLAWVVFRPNESVTGWVIAVFLSFTVMGIGMLLDCLVARQEISPAGLVYRTIFGQTYSIAWPELRRVSYASQMKWFRLESTGGNVARISVARIGLPELARLILDHAPGSAIDPPTRAILQETAAGRPPSVWI